MFLSQVGSVQVPPILRSSNAVSNVCLTSASTIPFPCCTSEKTAPLPLFSAGFVTSLDRNWRESSWQVRVAGCQAEADLSDSTIVARVVAVDGS